MTTTTVDALPFLWETRTLPLLHQIDEDGYEEVNALAYVPVHAVVGTAWEPHRLLRLAEVVARSKARTISQALDQLHPVALSGYRLFDEHGEETGQVYYTVTDGLHRVGLHRAFGKRLVKADLSCLMDVYPHLYYVTREPYRVQSNDLFHRYTLWRRESSTASRMIDTIIEAEWLDMQALGIPLHQRT